MSLPLERGPSGDVEQGAPERRRRSCFERQFDDFAHGELGEQAWRPERCVPAPVGPRRWGLRRLTSWPNNSTRPWDSDEAADGVQERRFPGAVGADETDHLARHGPEADVIDRHQAGIRHRQVDAPQYRPVAVRLHARRRRGRG